MVVLIWHSLISLITCQYRDFNFESESHIHMWHTWCEPGLRRTASFLVVFSWKELGTTRNKVVLWKPGVNRLRLLFRCFVSKYVHRCCWYPLSVGDHNRSFRSPKSEFTIDEITLWLNELPDSTIFLRHTQFQKHNLLTQGRFCSRQALTVRDPDLGSFPESLWNF